MTDRFPSRSVADSGEFWDQAATTHICRRDAGPPRSHEKRRTHERPPSARPRRARWIWKSKEVIPQGGRNRRRSAPVIENDIFIDYRNVSRQQVSDGSNNSCWGEIAFGIIIAADNQNATG